MWQICAAQASNVIKGLIYSTFNLYFYAILTCLKIIRHFMHVIGESKVQVKATYRLWLKSKTVFATFETYVKSFGKDSLCTFTYVKGVW